jgi:hypothetical protein
MPWSDRQKYAETAFPEGNAVTDDTTGGILGITTFGNQLIISERSRMLIWNDYDVDSLQNGEPADDVYGEPDFSTITYQRYYVSPQVDASNRLWVYTGSGGDYYLEAFAHPLSHESAPIKEVHVAGSGSPPLLVRGGSTTEVSSNGFIDFAVVDSGDKIWIADRDKNRVLRINNIDGLEEPGTDPYVDVVLGQQTITGSEINQGGDIGPQTLAYPYNVGISPEGDLFVTDNGGEVGSNRRIIQYNEDRFPDNPGTVLFNADIGDPDRVIGTGGSFTTNGLYSLDPMCSPFELGFHPRGAVVAPMNGYSAQRFPLAYLDPVIDSLPQFALGDFTSYPVSCFVDADGNVYVGDFDWYRVLVYKKPFAEVNMFFALYDIEPVPLSQNVMISWKSRLGRSYEVYWTEDRPGDSVTWNEASGPEAIQDGTGYSLHFTDDGVSTFGDESYAPLNDSVPSRYYRVREIRE